MPLHTSTVHRRVGPGEVVQLQLRKPWPTLPIAHPVRVRLMVAGEDLSLAFLSPMANDGWIVKTAPPTTVEGILSGQGLLGQRPEDWNALLGVLSRWSPLPRTGLDLMRFTSWTQRVTMSVRSHRGWIFNSCDPSGGP